MRVIKEVLPEGLELGKRVKLFVPVQREPVGLHWALLNHLSDAAKPFAIVINPAAHLDFEMMQPVGTNARSQRLRQPVVETLLRGNVFVKEGIGEAHRLTERDLTKRLFGEKVGRRLAGQTRMQFTQAHADLV